MDGLGKKASCDQQLPHEGPEKAYLISKMSKKLAKVRGVTEAMECRGPKWHRQEENRQVGGTVAFLQS